jgi:hypothetical protein
VAHRDAVQRAVEPQRRDKTGREIVGCLERRIFISASSGSNSLRLRGTARPFSR